MTVDDWTTRWAEVARQHRGGEHFGELVAAMRLLQDRVTGLALPAERVPEVAGRLAELAAQLEPFQVSEDDRWDGTRADLPGRGTPLLPAYTVDEHGEGWLRGRVTFTRFHLGAGAAVHGGVHTLLFDDVMGHLAGLAGGISRTAYLTVNYRRITPLDVPLTFDCSVDGVEGRKRFTSGRLRDPEGAIVSDTEALMIQLQPGQP